MATVPTFDDLFQAGRREVVARPTRLTPEVVDTAGSDVNIAMAAVAAMAEETAAYCQGRFNATRLATALSVSEDDLDQWGASEIASEPARRGALSAIAYLRWDRQAGSSTTVPAGTLVSTAGGVTFRTVTDLIFPTSSIGPLFGTAVASTAGPGGNVPKDTIAAILSPLVDPTITVTNPEDAVGGTPPETPEDYQARLQTAYPRARRGTLAAIEAAAQAVDGVASARAYELLNGTALTGRVIVQVLGEGGTSNRALALRVQAVLDEYRCGGVPVIIFALSPLSVPITASGLVVSSGLDPGAVLGQAQRALVALVDGLVVGETLYRSRILGTLASIAGLAVPDGALTAPATDVAPGDNEYVVTSTDLVVLTAAS